MDITIEVMLPPRGAANYLTSANVKWRVLSPVAVYPLKTTATVGMPNTGYIHVTGIPERPTWAGLTPEQLIGKLNAKLCEPWEERVTVGDETTLNRIERRKWSGLASAMSNNARNRLLADRQITMNWTQFKSVMRHLIESRQLTDADFD